MTLATEGVGSIPGHGQSIMAGNTTAITPLSRRTSPELWIPYVMIGASCVTFLAFHFWCYHKRNRQRYLRKRDEKRVKCGLLERRRITTLMVARYQSELDPDKNNGDLGLAEDGCPPSFLESTKLDQYVQRTSIPGLQRDLNHKVANGSVVSNGVIIESVGKDHFDGSFKPLSYSEIWVHDRSNPASDSRRNSHECNEGMVGSRRQSVPRYSSLMESGIADDSPMSYNYLQNDSWEFSGTKSHPVPDVDDTYCDENTQVLNRFRSEYAENSAYPPLPRNCQGNMEIPQHESQHGFKNHGFVFHTNTEAVADTNPCHVTWERPPSRYIQRKSDSSPVLGRERREKTHDVMCHPPGPERSRYADSSYCHPMSHSKKELNAGHPLDVRILLTQRQKEGNNITSDDSSQVHERRESKESVSTTSSNQALLKNTQHQERRHRRRSVEDTDASTSSGPHVTKGRRPLIKREAYYGALRSYGSYGGDSSTDDVIFSDGPSETTEQISDSFTDQSVIQVSEYQMTENRQKSKDFTNDEKLSSVDYPVSGGRRRSKDLKTEGKRCSGNHGHLHILETVPSERESLEATELDQTPEAPIASFDEISVTSEDQFQKQPEDPISDLSQNHIQTRNVHPKDGVLPENKPIVPNGKPKPLQTPSLRKLDPDLKFQHNKRKHFSK